MTLDKNTINRKILNLNEINPEGVKNDLEYGIIALLLDSGLPPSMWILAAEASTHIYNRTPHKSNDFKTPLGKFSPIQKLHLDKIKRFGCIAYARIPVTDTKFSSSAIKSVLVGFSSSGYILGR